jgi:hypothetical protein
MSLQCFHKLGVIAYFNLNRQYIAEVLCINKEKPMQACHGQCFLKKNLNLTEEPIPEDTEVPATRQQIEFPLFLVSNLTYSFNVISSATEGNFFHALVTSEGHPRITFRPPVFFS